MNNEHLKCQNNEQYCLEDLNLMVFCSLTFRSFSFFLSHLLYVHIHRYYIYTFMHNSHIPNYSSLFYLQTSVAHVLVFPFFLSKLFFLLVFFFLLYFFSYFHIPGNRAFLNCLVQLKSIAIDSLRSKKIEKSTCRDMKHARYYVTLFNYFFLEEKVKNKRTKSLSDVIMCH